MNVWAVWGQVVDPYPQAHRVRAGTLPYIQGEFNMGTNKKELKLKLIEYEQALIFWLFIKDAFVDFLVKGSTLSKASRRPLL
jgi:hypothetical protein